jgi:hypothetical protein
VQRHGAALTRRPHSALPLVGRRGRAPSSRGRSSRISSRRRLLVLLLVHGLLRVLLLRWRPATRRRLAHLPVRVAITSLLAISPTAVLLLIVVRIVPLLVASLVVCVVIVLLRLVLLAAKTGWMPSLRRASLAAMRLLPRLLVVVVLLLVRHGWIVVSEQVPAGSSQS